MSWELYLIIFLGAVLAHLRLERMGRRMGESAELGYCSALDGLDE